MSSSEAVLSISSEGIDVVDYTHNFPISELIGDLREAGIEVKARDIPCG